MDEEGEIGLFHEKLGLMIDEEDNVIAFSGSMNESETAFKINYEAFDVFTSWSMMQIVFLVNNRHLLLCGTIMSLV